MLIMKQHHNNIINTTSLALIRRQSLHNIILQKKVLTLCHDTECISYTIMNFWLIEGIFINNPSEIAFLGSGNTNHMSQ